MGFGRCPASGWERSYASRYYTQRIKLQIRALKTTLLVDTRARTVLDLHVTTIRKHDTQIAPRLTQRNLERFQTLAADKGYDDRTHRNRLRSWGKRPLIKHREFKPYDKAANARMEARAYHRRSLVETVISSLKRKYSAAVSSRVWWRQFRELVAICLVYNVERSVKLGVTLLDFLLLRLLYSLQWRISTEPHIQEVTMFKSFRLSSGQILLVGVVLGTLLTVGIGSQQLWTASARLPGSIIADFLVIRDSSFELSGTESKTIQFDLPADTDLSGMGVIAFAFRPRSNAKDLTVEIQLNGNVLGTALLIGEDIARGVWETFNQDGKALKLTGNILQFKIVAGTGRVDIRDVVLWYHRTI